MTDQLYQQFATSAQPWLVPIIIILVITGITLVIVNGHLRKKAGKKPIASKRTKVLVAVGVLVAWFIFDISGFGGNIRFYSKWAECEAKPLVPRGSGFMNSRGLTYSDAPDFSLMRLSPTYFCTPDEAEQAGYSRG